MSVEPCCLATAIGSLPHKDPQQAVKVVLRSIPNAPIWPQLPAFGLNEQMEIQYSEGIPARGPRSAKRAACTSTPPATPAAIWPSFTKSSAPTTVEAFRITPEFSKGIYAMEAALKAAGGNASFREGADHRPAQRRPQHRR